MSLGYDVYDSGRDFSQKGITGKVQRYSSESMEYPCYILRSEPGNPVGMHKVKVLKHMFDTTVAYSDIESGSQIYVYFSKEGKTARIGKIYPHQVKSFLRLFDGNEIDCFMDSSTELEGDYKYVLSD